jgi:hypothetical protein
MPLVSVLGRLVVRVLIVAGIHCWTVSSWKIEQSNQPCFTCAEVFRLLISFVTMEIGIRPGFTTETFTNSLPKSTAMRAPDASPREHNTTIITTPYFVYRLLLCPDVCLLTAIVASMLKFAS